MFYILMDFYQKFIFKLNMVNFSMQTKIKMSWLVTLWRYQAIKEVNYKRLVQKL